MLIDPRGELLGVYRKTHPFCSEAVSGGGWVTPGDTVTVCDTELGRIGMIICFDGDYPELSRIQAVQGAEVICRPSALLRSADIWELTSRARAYDNHVFVVGANAVGADPAGVLYFGNSHVVTPIGHIVAKAATHEGWVSARLDPAEALSALTPGSNITQGFDHLRDRNLDLIRNHRADLEGPGEVVLPARLTPARAMPSRPAGCRQPGFVPRTHQAVAVRSNGPGPTLAASSVAQGGAAGIRQARDVDAGRTLAGEERLPVVVEVVEAGRHLTPPASTSSRPERRQSSASPPGRPSGIGGLVLARRPRGRAAPRRPRAGGASPSARRSPRRRPPAPPGSRDATQLGDAPGRGRARS